MAQRGKLYLVYVNISNDPNVLDYQALDGQKSFNRTRTATTVDAGDKLQSVRTQLPGDRSEEYTVEANYVPLSLTQQAVETAYKLGIPVLIRGINNGVPKFEVLASVTNYSEAHPDQDVSSISLTLVPYSDVVDL